VQFGHHQNTQVSLTEVGSPGDWHNTFMDDPWPCNGSISNQDGELTCDEQGD